MKKVLSVILAVAMLLSSAAVFGRGVYAASSASDAKYISFGTDTYTRNSNQSVYDFVLGDYAELVDAARAKTNYDEQLVAYAKAEAELIDSAVVLPINSSGGNYAISRVAPYTVPFVSFGLDQYLCSGMVVSEDILTTAERDELKTKWETARKGSGSYDPKSYLKSKGHTIKTEYKELTTTIPSDLDIQTISNSNILKILVNTTDGLVRYNNFGAIVPAIASSWDISADGKTYTFHLRNDVYWYTSTGSKYAKLTAKDFVAGLRHALDAEMGLEYVIQGKVVGISDYMMYMSDTYWDKVGIKAVNDTTLTITLENALPAFLSMLNYQMFKPICSSFYLANGGVYGADFQEVRYSSDYTYAASADPATQVYCGAFRITEIDEATGVTLKKNTGYYDASNVTLNTVKFVYDIESDNLGRYRNAVDGVYDAASISAYSLETVQSETFFKKHAYVSSLSSTVYYGTLNMNRGTFVSPDGSLASPKSEKQKIDAATALTNKNFRKALLYAFDKSAYNAVAYGEMVKDNSLRNTISSPDLAAISTAVKADGMTFAAGSTYGEIIQKYLTKKGSHINTGDGVNGWYSATGAQSAFEAAMAELGTAVSYPIQLDYVYYDSSTSQQQAEAMKGSIESVLGSENVVINLIMASSVLDYYGAYYYCEYGSEVNLDLCTGTGWAADYADPDNYLSTFMPGGNFIHLIGLSGSTVPTTVSISNLLNGGTDVGVTIKWTADGDFEKYQVQRKVGSGSWTTLTSIATGSRYTDSKATVGGETYSYRVRGYYDGAWKSFSSAVSIVRNPFKDVKDNASYFKALMWAYNNNIVAGTSTTQFSPNANCTRGQFALMLWRMNGKPSTKGMENPFTDVKSSNGFYNGIVWCYNKGITAGTSATTYSPNDNIKRWQMILMFWRMQNKPASSLTENPFTDVKTTASYYKAALWAYEKKITAVEKFMPNDLCTRWQLVFFLYRLNNLYHYI